MSEEPELDGCGQDEDPVLEVSIPHACEVLDKLFKVFSLASLHIGFGGKVGVKTTGGVHHDGESLLEVVRKLIDLKVDACSERVAGAERDLIAFSDREKTARACLNEAQKLRKLCYPTER